MLIDGTSQTGYSGTPIIEINGGGLTGDGLLLAPGSDGSTIKGLDIADFTTGAGIHIQSNDNLIQSNFLGTDLTGTIALGNQNGLFIDGGSGNTIGGSSTGARNLVSANQRLWHQSQQQLFQRHPGQLRGHRHFRDGCPGERI